MKNRGMFWLIWAVAFFPMLLAMVSYFGGVGQPQARVNNGQLVAAGMTLETLQLKSEQGIPYQADGTWRLLLLVGPGCTTACAVWRTQLPNLHAALGKDRNRVQYHEIRTDRERLANQLVLADPLGNMVMSYQLEQSAEAVLDDLTRLLKVSKLG